MSTGSANAAIDLSAAGRLGITVCATGYVSDPTVEHTRALILAAARNLLVEADSMRAGGRQVTVGTGLRGKTLGVLGLGRVGSLVARIGQAFGMTTIAWSQSLTPQKAAEHDVQAVTKEQLKRRNSSLMLRVIEPVISRTIGKTVYDDLRRMESIIRDSHLDLTIVRPSILFALDHPAGYIAGDAAPVGGFTGRIDLPDHADRRRIEQWRHPHRLHDRRRSHVLGEHQTPVGRTELINGE